VCTFALHVYSQHDATAYYMNPVHLDTGWTSVQIPPFKNINIARISEGLVYRYGATGQLLVKVDNSPKYLFHIEFHSNKESYYILFIKNKNEQNEILKLDSCALSFEKFTDRKLYLTAKTVPDELYAFWNNTVIPLKRSGRSITIHLPLYVDELETSYIRVYAVKNQKLCKELIIPLQQGKPTNMSESFSGVAWNGTNEIKLIKADNANEVETTSKNTIDIINTQVIESNDTLDEIPKQVRVLPDWISIYTDVYYALYNDSVGTNQYQQFPSISPKSNSFGLNTVQIDFQYESELIRAAASFHYGDYAKTNWSTDFNNIMEARAGFRLFKKLWVDAGFFRTYIGAEGLLPRENICSSTAIATYYEQAYISGVRLNFIPTEKWNIQFYAMNAYNGFEDNNDKKSIGSLISYTINDNGNAGISNYLGDDTTGDADSISHLRFYQNVFFNYQLNKFKFQIGLDFCIQQNSGLKNPNEPGSMLSGMATAGYSFTKAISMYARYEYFNDADAILSTLIVDTNGNLTGYKLSGITAGFEVRPYDTFFVRLEGRRLQMDSAQNIFHRDGSARNNRSEIMMNMGITF
jgi:hypothetical protein